MPTAKVPLVGSYNTRGIDGSDSLTLNQDQRFLNCTFNVVQNPVTGRSTVYVEKRPGWGVDSVVASGSVSTGLIRPQSFNATITAFGDTDSTIYRGTISVGTITGRALHFTETLVSTTSYVLIKSSDGSGWYYPIDSGDVTAYTADGNNSTTITDIKIAGANSTAGLYPGQLLAAASNIAAGTRVVSVNSGAFTAVLDTATTGGAFADLAITKTPVARITDSDFITTGTAISSFVEMDGYVFYTTEDGKLRNSDLNSVTEYTSTSYVSPNMSPDPPKALARYKNMIIVLGGSSKEAFYNAGNVSGSPLQRAPQFFDRIGVLNQRSVTTLENDIYFVSSPNAGDLGIYRIRGLASMKVSTPSVDRIIGDVSSGGDIFASSFRLGGYSYAAFFVSLSSELLSYLLLESTDNILLETGDDILKESGSSESSSFGRLMLYNTEINVWSEWDSTEATYIEGIGSSAANKIVATSRVETGGKIYTIGATEGELHRDDGSSYTMEIRTSKLDHGTGKRKIVPEIRLICDQQESGTVTLECSDDDYATWTTLGTFDLTSMNPKITRCGSYKGGRSYRLTDSNNSAFRGESLEIDYQIANA